MKIYHKKNFGLGLWSVLLAALCSLGKWNGSMLCVGAGLGLGAAFIFALTADFFTWVYYDEHI